MKHLKYFFTGILMLVGGFLTVVTFPIWLIYKIGKEIYNGR